MPGSYFTETPEGVVLSVRAQPRSSRAGIDGLVDGAAVKVRIRTAPVDGKANKELVETLADEFGLAKSAARRLGRLREAARESGEGEGDRENVFHRRGFPFRLQFQKRAAMAPKKSATAPKTRSRSQTT